MEYLAFGCRVLIGLVFALSAFSKLRSRPAFAEFAAVTRTLLRALVPGRSAGRAGARRVGAAVAVLEAAVPVLLVVPAAVPAGHAVALALLAAFAAGIAAALRGGVRTACRCFGASAAPLGARHLARNGVLALAALTGLVAGPGRVAAAEPAGLAVAATAAAVLALLVIRFDDLIDLFADPAPVDGRGPQ
ncbi:MauE/DoxX family redox-associated membrane protein [Actinomadura kijaniata]|uniref:MauE/DoxX family redox-associated membrane protein n=1 Tax=Actinomadura kijaniata TaxID=46161 RepID=UPI003F1D9777